MGETLPQVFVAVFEDATRASRVHGQFAALEERGLIRLLATAAISRDRGGDVTWSIRGLGVGDICSRADTIATILDVLLPAPVLVAGLTAASSDAPDRESAERDFVEAFARRIADGVAPGGSVFIGVVEDRWVTAVQRGLGGYHRLTPKRP